jgi:RNA polymerase sigma-70 factor (ECF subfamily)
MANDASAELLARWRGGETRAAEELFGRYTERLLALARCHLSGKIAQRLDPEDVVQSAYRSFFTDVNRYTLQRSGDLWRLLAAITIHKLHHQVARHTAAKRSVEREQSFEAEGVMLGVEADAVAQDPSPSAAVAVVDELQQLMADLAPLHRRMVELRLQGYQVREIAGETERSERFVRKVIEEVRARLLRRRHNSSAA